MGEARQRRLADLTLAQRIAHLAPPAQTVARVAWCFNRELDRFGGGACYRAACFLRLFLHEVHGVDGQAVVGFVNDRTDDAYSNHAWFEFDGAVTDLQIRAPLYPELQPRGPLLVQDIEFQPGHSYSYHRERPAEAQAAHLWRLQQLPAGHPLLIHSLEATGNHDRMAVIVTDDRMLRDWLDAAPDGVTYQRLAARVVDRMRS